MKKYILPVLFFIVCLVANQSSLHAQWVPTTLNHSPNATNYFAVIGGTLYGGGDGVYRTTDNGTTWKDKDSGLTNFTISALKNVGEDIFVATQGGVYYSSDGGTYWSVRNKGMEGYIVSAFADSGKYLFAAAGSTISGGGVFLSTDSGLNWSATKWNDTLGSINFLSSLAISHSNLFVGTDFNGVYLTTDNGKHWISRNNGLTDTGINCLAVIDTTLFAGTQSGVFRSTDNGAHWEKANNGLSYMGMAQSVRVLTVFDMDLAAGTQYNGVYLTTNNGTSWTEVPNKGLLDSGITAVAVIDTNLFAASADADVYRRGTTELISGVDIKTERALPAQFALTQNYPNPFSGMTNIEYQIPNEGLVTLKVYNTLGEEIATLVNEKNVAGEHSVVFDASGLQNGVYFYSMSAGKNTQTGKMTIVR